MKCDLIYLKYYLLVLNNIPEDIFYFDLVYYIIYNVTKESFQSFITRGKMCRINGSIYIIHLYKKTINFSLDMWYVCMSMYTYT